MEIPKQTHVNCQDSRCKVCLDDSDRLSLYFDRITGLTNIDHLSHYHKWLGDNGINPETEWGWWTEDVFKPENLEAYTKQYEE